MVVKLALIISSLYFFVLFRLWHVNSIGESCKEAIQSIIMQLLNQGGTVEKVIKTTCDNRYLSGHGISLVPHLKLNPIPFHSFALGKILVDRFCFTVTSIPIFKARLNWFVLYILFQTRSTLKLAQGLVNILKRTIQHSFSKQFL